ncbi:hypothetical protein L1987_75879 [Smallanthus sonchifolius]|uniref:Uncharacterized protein n=1 Tax=Smallanthus sonchifolius TaxID=185202 RepID=A0ACB9AB40_9ASTR|nr:hypothetical protein L1987_75879 [Smallanthus sonchifolius]
MQFQPGQAHILLDRPVESQSDFSILHTIVEYFDLEQRSKPAPSSPFHSVCFPQFHINNPSPQLIQQIKSNNHLQGTIHLFTN